MANIILISDGEKHAWYVWLSAELVKRGHSFFAPVLPSLSEGVDEWVDAFKDYRRYLDESSVIIGHGAGRVVVLKILEDKLREVKGAMFVSGEEFGKVCPSFSFELVDFSVVSKKAKHFFAYASEQDSFESLKESDVFARFFNDEVLILDDSAYFKGMMKFEDLLIDIISLID